MLRASASLSRCCRRAPIRVLCSTATQQTTQQQTTMSTSKPQLTYFPIRGRAEVIRLALSFKEQDYEFEPVDRGAMKEQFAFGQCPRFVDGELELYQSNTILRYLARKLGLWGSNEKETCNADMVMEGVESIRQKYTALTYMDQFAPEAKAKYLTTHLDKTTVKERNGGAHFAFLARFLTSSATGYVAGGDSPTVGDLALWELVDIHARIPEFKACFEAQYPELLAHHAKIASLPTIKAYLESPKRPEKVNNNNLG